MKENFKIRLTQFDKLYKTNSGWTKHELEPNTTKFRRFRECILKLACLSYVNNCAFQFSSGCIWFDSIFHHIPIYLKLSLASSLHFHFSLSLGKVLHLRNLHPKGCYYAMWYTLFSSYSIQCKKKKLSTQRIAICSSFIFRIEIWWEENFDDDGGLEKECFYNTYLKRTTSYFGL